jgi:hypothetical protein
VPSLYTFHSYDSHGAPIAMQAAQFPSDAAAIEYLDRVLAEHRSAAYVLVCDAEREVATRHRTTVA